LVIAILLGIDERKGSGGTLAEQDSLAGFLGQRTGKGISVGETPETLLKQMNELIDVQGFAAFSKYLHGKINERLTSSSLSAREDRFGLRLSPELPNSTQLIVELQLQDLENDFLNIFFFHEEALPGDSGCISVLSQYYITYY
jgi:hypothetical protein